MSEIPKEHVRLLMVEVATAELQVGPFDSLFHALHPGDVLVVNDAATVPASLWATTETGQSIELRLFDPLHSQWSAFVLGAGDSHTRTEDRPEPPRLLEGAVLRIGSLEARVVGASPHSNRMIRLRFFAEPEGVWREIYKRGRPVQYAHRPDPAALWDVQNVYSARPWAAEHVSAGRALTWALLLKLRRAGVAVVALTEGAGLSSSGDLKLDAALPLPERFEISEHTATTINQARTRGGRVIAVGTSVMRALESSVNEQGHVVARSGTTSLIINGAHQRRVVSGLLTGIHQPQESHYRLLKSLLPEKTLQWATDLAHQFGLQEHEAGDAMLVLAD